MLHQFVSPVWAFNWHIYTRSSKAKEKAMYVLTASIFEMEMDRENITNAVKYYYVWAFRGPIYI